MQAKYTDLIIFNKSENVSELRFDLCLDRVGDLGLDTPWVKSDRGSVDKDILLGIDGALLAKTHDHGALESSILHRHHEHDHDHQSEVEVLSVTLKSTASPKISVDVAALENLLRSAPKEEVYRIKGIIRASLANPPAMSSEHDDQGVGPPSDSGEGVRQYILNWAFTRWTFTPTVAVDEGLDPTAIARLTMILARYESAKWKKKLEAGGLVQAEDNPPAELTVERLL